MRCCMCPPAPLIPLAGLATAAEAGEVRGHEAVGLGRGEGLAELDRRRRRGGGRGDVDDRVVVRGRRVGHGIVSSGGCGPAPANHGAWRSGEVPGRAMLV